MKVTQVFIPISIAVILFMSVMTVEAAPMNICDWLVQEGRICSIGADGRPKFSCEAGYEFPKNSNHKVCNPVEWKCHVDDADPDKMIKCDSDKWNCDKFGDVVICGIIISRSYND